MSWLRTYIAWNEDIGAAQDRFSSLHEAAGLAEDFAMLSRSEGLPAGDTYVLLSPRAASCSGVVFPGKVWERVEAPPARGTGVLVANGDPIRGLRLK